jgi:hypothetical protein
MTTLLKRRHCRQFDGQYDHKHMGERGRFYDDEIVALLLADFQKEVDTTRSRASTAPSARVPGHEWVPNLTETKQVELQSYTWH